MEVVIVWTVHHQQVRLVWEKSSTVQPVVVQRTFPHHLHQDLGSTKQLQRSRQVSPKLTPNILQSQLVSYAFSFFSSFHNFRFGMTLPSLPRFNILTPFLPLPLVTWYNTCVVLTCAWFCVQSSGRFIPHNRAAGQDGICHRVSLISCHQLYKMYEFISVKKKGWLSEAKIYCYCDMFAVC